MKKILLIALVSITIGKTNAQDFHLSMYDAAPLFLNPAMTGVFDSDWRVHMHYRTQWKAVNFKPYTTGTVSFDVPYKKWGFGGQIINYHAGIGNYNALQFLGSAAYTNPIDANKYHNISMGVQLGGTQKSIEYRILEPSEQRFLQQTHPRCALGFARVDFEGVQEIPGRVLSIF